MSSVRFGVVGLGFFGEKHVEALSSIPGVDVSAVCTRRDWRLREIAEKFDVPNAYRDYRELLANSDIDVVSVVTHVKDHIEPTLAAIEAGKHVFLEKPMAASVEECDRIIEAANRSDKFVMVGHICRFDPRYSVAKNAIEAGRLGRILTLSARRNIPAAVSESVLANLSPLFGDGVHDTDLMLWLTGESVESVYARTLSVRDLANPDIGWATYTFESGAIGVIESNWCLPAGTPYELDARMEIIGTKGAIYIDGSDRCLTIQSTDNLKVHDVTYWPRVHGSRVGALRDELIYFVNCITRDEAPSAITLEESRTAVAVAAAADRSAREGGIVIRLQGKGCP